MKSGVLIFSLILAVASSQSLLKCVQDYASCVIPLVNNRNNLMTCSVVIPFAQCITKVSKECIPNRAPLLERFSNIVGNVCAPDVAMLEELKKAAGCLIQNAGVFKSCSEDLSEDFCSVPSSFANCTGSRMREKCGDFVGELVDKLMIPLNLLSQQCKKAGIELDETTMCLLKSSRNFLSCKFEGGFSTVGDICRSANGFTQCVLEKSRETCGPQAEQQLETYMESINFVMKVCQSLELVGEIPLSECNKNVLKCSVDIFNTDELKCADITKAFNCMTDTTKICVEGENPFYLTLLERYKPKIPEYCNKDSPFNKKLKQEYACLQSKAHEVSVACYKTLDKDLGEVRMFEATGILRSYVNFLSCLSRGFGDKCSKQAEEVLNDLLQPIADSLDDSCRKLTGKRCNSACGLQVATWLFLGCLTYLLTRKHD